MKIREIAINTVFKHPHSVLNKYAWCVQEQYWSFLKRYDTNQFAKVVVRVDDSDNSIIRDRELDESHINVATINRYFNIASFLILNKQEKKRSLLELLHDSMLHLAGYYRWDKSPLIMAYDECSRNDIEYQFKVKNKDFKSPNKEFIGYMLCNWDLEYFTVTGIISTKNGSTFKEQELIKIEPYHGEFIYYSNCKWDDPYTFSLYSKEGKRWSIGVLAIV